MGEYQQGLRHHLLSLAVSSQCVIHIFFGNIEQLFLLAIPYSDHVQPEKMKCLQFNRLSTLTTLECGCPKTTT